MTTPYEALKPQQIAAATHLVAGASGRKTAELIGIAAETLSRWRQNPNFMAFLNQLKKDAVGDAREHLRSLNSRAVKAVEELLDSPTDTIRLSAAKFVLHSMLLDADTAGQGIGATDPVFAQLETFNPTGGPL